MWKTTNLDFHNILSSQEAQEGSWGGCDQEEDSPCPEVPACRRWSNSAGKILLFLSVRSNSTVQKPILSFLTIYGQDIMAKRNQKPEVRKAQREQAVRAAKDQKKTTVKKPAVKVRLSNLSTPVFLWGLHSIISRTRLRRRHKRQRRMSRRPAPEGLVARDKYFVMAICSINDCPARLHCYHSLFLKASRRGCKGRVQ